MSLRTSITFIDTSDLFEQRFKDEFKIRTIVLAKTYGL